MKKILSWLITGIIAAAVISSAVYARRAKKPKPKYNPLDMYRNTRMQNRMFVHQKIKIGDYIIYETHNAQVNDTIRTSYQVVKEANGLYCAVMKSRAEGLLAKTVNLHFYELWFGKDGYVDRGYICETANPANKIELVKAVDGDPEFIPKFMSIDFEADAKADEEIRKLGKKVGKDQVEYETPKGEKVVVSLKAYMIKGGVSQGRQYSQLVILFTHPEVPFLSFCTLQLIESHGVYNVGVTQCVEYGNKAVE